MEFLRSSSCARFAFGFSCRRLAGTGRGDDDHAPDDQIPASRTDAGYGRPYSYFGQHVDARVEPQRSDLVKKAIVPDYALSSHVAPLGLAFYTASSLPQKYHGGAFVCEHGSWDRPQLNGYKVVSSHSAAATPAARRRTSRPVSSTSKARRAGARSASRSTRAARC
jgi:glucose/arabinose dehydrogenase